MRTNPEGFVNNRTGVSRRDTASTLDAPPGNSVPARRLTRAELVPGPGQMRQDWGECGATRLLRKLLTEALFGGEAFSTSNPLTTADADPAPMRATPVTV